jgi:hypothetical protein
MHPYGWEHKQRRARLIPPALGKLCPDCGKPMTDPRRMVANHTDPLRNNPHSHADSVHCRHCSDRQGGTIRGGRKNRPHSQHPGRVTP